MTGFQKISISDKNYPALLKEIAKAPEFFYVWTSQAQLDFHLALLNQPAIAIVGTRRCSEYGKEASTHFAKSLAMAGFVIVSGLARGIDEAAHKGALSVGGKTIAVIGSGLDKNSLYPPQNYQLAEQIVEQGGLVISEHQERTPPLAQYFPQRNRIISGLSLGVIVVEAPEKSGALITAEFALQQNREVFAVPGQVFHLNAYGPNSLVQKGAKLVMRPEDVIEEFPQYAMIDATNKSAMLDARKYEPQSVEEEKVLELLRQKALSIDQLVEKADLPIVTISPILTVLEIKGVIRKQDERYTLS